MGAHRIPMRGLALAAFLFGASTLSAQLPSASPAAHGLGGSFTAIARGYEAVAWNPANLAMPGRPFFSIGLAIAGGSLGLDPVDFRALHGFSGQVVDSATRISWINQARLSGGQHGRLDGGVTPIAFSVGPVGFQFGSTAYTNATLSPDAWEAMLFGNAGNNNEQPKNLDLTGTSIRGGVTSAAAMSFALPIPINLTNGVLANEKAAMGVTAKYVMGHAVFIAQDVGSVIGSSDLEIAFPVILPDSNYNGTLGNGVGADLALAWSGGAWRVGLLAENVFNTFAWDTTVLASVSGVGLYSTSSSGAEPDFEEQLPFGAAPAELRQLVTSQRYMPSFTLGAAFRLTNSLLITADMKTSTGGEEAIIAGPKSRIGVGAEWRLLSFLPLRAGVASVTDGWQAAAGVGLRLLGYEMGLSTSIRRRGTANESGVMFGLVGIGR